MAAAADWANSLKIKSGSFQVAEVAPNMHKAFEREVCRIHEAHCVVVVVV